MISALLPLALFFSGPMNSALKNYAAINTGFPRFAVLFSPFSGTGLFSLYCSLLVIGDRFIN